MPVLGNLPNSVRYIKNGAGGRWWKAAKDNGQIHAGWGDIPSEVLIASDMAQIESLVREAVGNKSGATQDYNALATLLVRPSQHVWVTFQDGCMWWCTVKDGITINPDGETSVSGHFWLTCERSWSNHSLENKKILVKSALPGYVTRTEGYRRTICEPEGAAAIIRIINNEEDADAAAATAARLELSHAATRLIDRLGPKDFELLIDLIWSRSGWMRLDRLGSTTEGVDIEVENIATNEIAFIQVKSVATQAVLDDYIDRFRARRERYDRMIFVVHSPQEKLKIPAGEPVALWHKAEIADLVVKLGLADWLASRV